MKKAFLTFVFFGLLFRVVFAQPGHYFISHYKPGTDNFNYLSYDIVQDPNGILYFANHSGVLQFDGRSWSLVQVNGAIFSLAVSETGEVFAAGTYGFGKIGMNQENHLTYLSLSDSLPGAKNIFASCAVDSAVFFLSENTLFQYDLKANKAGVVLKSLAGQGSFSAIFRMTGGIYVATEDQGLKRVVNGKLEATTVTETVTSLIIFSKTSPDGKTDLIGTDDSRLYVRKKGLPPRLLKPRDSTYLTTSLVANASWVNDQMVAIGTLRGGVVFLDVESESTFGISNYHTGLPDNEIYAVYTDHHHGVWVAHDYGFSRIAPFLPFRTFSHYKGLQGNLLCAQNTRNGIYVGTTLGLFRLTREEIYEEEVYSVTKTITIKPKKNPSTTQTKRGGLLGFLKKKSKAEETPVVASKESGKPSKKTLTQTKTRRVLKGIEYVYQPVEGIPGKVDQLVMVNNRLLSTGVGGFFEVDGTKSTVITSDPVRVVYYSSNLKQVLVGTYDDEIKAFSLSNDKWMPADFPDSLSGYADYMFEDNLQNLWICGREHATKIEIEAGEILDAESIPLPHSSLERTVGVTFGSEVYLTQNGEFYHYTSFKNAFIKYDSLPGPKKYFASAGYFWFYDGHKWRTIDKRLQGTIKTEWLSLFPDIRFLAPAEQGKSLWVITSSNELYRFSSDTYQLNEEANPLFLKQIKSHQARLSTSQNLTIGEGESALTLEFIQPEYLSEQAVEYRYWVQGLQTRWSDWSSVNNIIQLSFLPQGDYKVLVQSKDLFGKVTELENVSFRVTPPYWKRPWFYALEFLFFGALVVVSIRTRVGRMRHAYLGRYLSALTIVLLIQFVQTIGSSYITIESTPVADFFIQVFIALLVLPVEEFLRNKMVRASEKSN